MTHDKCKRNLVGMSEGKTPLGRT